MRKYPRLLFQRRANSGGTQQQINIAWMANGRRRNSKKGFFSAETRCADIQTAKATLSQVRV